jgi:hypothetical protein
MAFVSITRLRVRSWRYLPVFLLHAFRSTRQAKKADGLISLLLLRDANFCFWTSTVWRDEAAMRVFLLSGDHRRAMPHLLDWCDEASIVHWTQEMPDAPSWPEAHRRMQQQGRPSKVRHPSEAHLRFEVPPPRAA